MISVYAVIVLATLAPVLLAEDPLKPPSLTDLNDALGISKISSSLQKAVNSVINVSPPGDETNSTSSKTLGNILNPLSQIGLVKDAITNVSDIFKGQNLGEQIKALHTFLVNILCPLCSLSPIKLFEEVCETICEIKGWKNGA